MQIAEQAINQQADALATRLTDGYLRVYEGVRLLAELRFGSFLPATNGKIEALSVQPDEFTRDSGIADTFVCYASDGVTELLRGDIPGDMSLTTDIPEADARKVEKRGRFVLDKFTYTLGATQYGR